jgi:hypothetical protein
LSVYRNPGTPPRADEDADKGEGNKERRRKRMRGLIDARTDIPGADKCRSMRRRVDGMNLLASAAAYRARHGKY